MMAALVSRRHCFQKHNDLTSSVNINQIRVNSDQILMCAQVNVFSQCYLYALETSGSTTHLPGLSIITDRASRSQSLCLYMNESCSLNRVLRGFLEVHWKGKWHNGLFLMVDIWLGVKNYSPCACFSWILRIVFTSVVSLFSVLPVVILTTLGPVLTLGKDPTHWKFWSDRVNHMRAA